MFLKTVVEGGPLQRRPDITLAKEKLQREPKIDVENGLNKTSEYFRSILEKK